MRRIALYILTSVFTFIIGVALAFSLIPRNVLDSVERTISCSPILPASYTTIESKILDGDSSWRFEEMTTNGKEDLRVIKFINANEGWVGGTNAALYKTTNAGKDWQKIPLNIPAKSSIQSISFVNSSTGWLVALVDGTREVEHGFLREPDFMQSWVLSTTDGGKTWQTQYYEKAQQLRLVQFVDKYEGWAMGSKVSENEYDKSLIIRTTDGGRHWTNLSANTDDKETEFWKSVANILATTPSNATTLHYDGKLYSTINGGTSWAQVGSLPEELPLEFLGRFELTGGNRMWAVGGNYGMTGARGMSGTLARMDSSCFWREYSIHRAYFADAAFVSENDVLVCGTIYDPAHNWSRWDRDGLIMNSKDGGANWRIVYQSSHTNFVAMTKIDRQNIWAISSGGVIVHLQPK